MWNGIKPLGECHLGPKKLRFPGPNPLPLARVMDLPASNALATGPIIQRSIGSFIYRVSVFCLLRSVFCVVCCEFFVHEFQGPPLQTALPPLTVRLLYYIIWGPIHVNHRSINSYFSMEDKVLCTRARFEVYPVISTYGLYSKTTKVTKLNITIWFYLNTFFCTLWFCSLMPFDFLVTAQAGSKFARSQTTSWQCCADTDLSATLPQPAEIRPAASIDYSCTHT